MGVIGMVHDSQLAFLPFKAFDNNKSGYVRHGVPCGREPPDDPILTASAPAHNSPCLPPHGRPEVPVAGESVGGLQRADPVQFSTVGETGTGVPFRPMACSPRRPRR